MTPPGKQSLFARVNLYFPLLNNILFQINQCRLQVCLLPPPPHKYTCVVSFEFSVKFNRLFQSKPIWANLPPEANKLLDLTVNFKANSCFGPGCEKINCGKKIQNFKQTVEKVASLLQNLFISKQLPTAVVIKVFKICCVLLGFFFVTGTN